MERNMMTSLKGLLAVVVVSLPAVAFAQSTDAAYCGALVTKYEQYLDMSSKRGRQPQSLESRAAVAQCKAGDPAGIPGIEKALQDAKVALPSHTVTAGVAPAQDPNCGIETWSTDKMMYVSTPCASATTDENPAGASK
jgi:hypothetical protein